MGCFCHKSLLPLSALLPNINVSASVALPGTPIVLALSEYLSAAGLPAEPWQPDLAWLGLGQPSLRLSAQAVATISAMASLRAQVLAQFGLDLLIALQAKAFARVVATMNARLSAMAHLNLNPLAWLELARLNAAIDQVTIPLQAGLLMPSPSLMMALSVPGGIPMPRWTSLLALLRLLAPDDRRFDEAQRQLVRDRAARRGAAHAGRPVAAGFGRAATDGQSHRGAVGVGATAGESWPWRQPVDPRVSGYPTAGAGAACRIAAGAVAAARRRHQPWLVARGTAVAAAEVAAGSDQLRDQRGGAGRAASPGDSNAELAGAGADPGGSNRADDLRVGGPASGGARDQRGAGRAMRLGLRRGCYHARWRRRQRHRGGDPALGGLPRSAGCLFQ